jgi:hypothetical protein
MVSNATRNRAPRPLWAEALHFVYTACLACDDMSGDCERRVVINGERVSHAILFTHEREVLHLPAVQLANYSIEGTLRSNVNDRLPERVLKK